MKKKSHPCLTWMTIHCYKIIVHLGLKWLKGTQKHPNFLLYYTHWLQPLLYNLTDVPATMLPKLMLIKWLPPSNMCVEINSKRCFKDLLLVAIGYVCYVGSCVLIVFFGLYGCEVVLLFLVKELCYC